MIARGASGFGCDGEPLRKNVYVKDATQAMADPDANNPIQGGSKMDSTNDILDRHLRSFGEHNLQGILSDYAPGAVLFTPVGPLRSADAIKAFFQMLLTEFGKPGATFNLIQQSAEADYGYILWTAETADNVYELGTDTFVVRDGKIAAQSFAGKITPKRVGNF
jgi:hypothetical protein